MWKRTKTLALILLPAAALALLAFALLRATPDPEPQYKGRPLSYWLVQARPIVDDTYPRIQVLQDYLAAFRSPVATEAIQAIGTNAIPYYLKWIRYEGSSWRKKLAAKIPPHTTWTFRINAWVGTTRSDLLAMASGVALAQLGSNAAAASPALAALIHNTNAPQTALRATRALCYLGTNGLQPLISAIHDPQYSLRPVAILCLSCTTGSEAPGTTTIPVLIEFLGDTNSRVNAVCGLGRNTSVPALAIPALTGCLSSTSAVVRLQAAAALRYYGSQATPALPALTNSLADPDYKVRVIATNSINSITAALSTNAPAY